MMMCDETDRSGVGLDDVVVLFVALKPRPWNYWQGEAFYFVTSGKDGADDAFLAVMGDGCAGFWLLAHKRGLGPVSTVSDRLLIDLRPVFIHADGIEYMETVDHLKFYVSENFRILCENQQGSEERHLIDYFDARLREQGCQP
jgi:hypothetical protein